MIAKENVKFVLYKELDMFHTLRQYREQGGERMLSPVVLPELQDNSTIQFLTAITFNSCCMVVVLAEVHLS